MPAKVDNKRIDALVAASITHYRLPGERGRSIARGRRPKLSDRKPFTLVLEFQVYFRGPNSPWQSPLPRVSQSLGTVVHVGTVRQFTETPVHRLKARGLRLP